MKKSLFIFLAALMAVIGAKADLTADWKLYMPFDQWPVQIIETPGRVYFMSRTFEKRDALPERAVASHSLFYYDKEGDEIVSVNERVNANGNAVAVMGYNDAKKYLLVVYTNCDIDFIYDDGRVINVPALKIASIPGKKEANSINFDIKNNTVYVATSFGYIALNDEKHEVSESRTYNENIQSIARSGDVIMLCTGKRPYFAPASSQRFNLEAYTPAADVPDVSSLIPLGNGKFAGFISGGSTSLYIMEGDGNSIKWEKASSDSNTFGYQMIPSGYRLAGQFMLYEIKNDGTVETMSRPESISKMPATSYNGKEIWGLTSMKGIQSYENKDGKFTLTRDYMRPNAPATYISSSFAYSPIYGLLCSANGQDWAYTDMNQSTPANVSSLKDGFWKEFGPNYSGVSSLTKLNNFGGLVIDPQNPNHAYLSSVTSGIMRINLANPSEILMMAQEANVNNGKEGFIKIADNQNVWSSLCRFAPVSFTSDGTMWTIYNDTDNERNVVWYWPAADRLATTSQASYRPMKKFNLPNDFFPGNFDRFVHFSKTKNLLAIGSLMADYGLLMIYDYNGTPETNSDDRYVLLTHNTMQDQDGGGVNFLGINNLYEDPATGLLWILTQRGVFTLNPATIFEDPTRVNRIKVSRNDGTNLADYLLNEINVHHLSTDAEGRKWFSTSNGLVCTSDDGRTILAEFTTDNSYLPSNNVYATCYNPDNNSIMVATEGGLVEMFPSGSGNDSSGDNAGIRAYPNPVEPDFYGWVRIDNIADGSLVKITDAKGGIVKELGPAQGGSVEWDVSGLNNTRVTTGVYYIMVSPGSNGGNTQISKILVLN